jgi:cytochrome c oxidase assembly protein subunit 15
VIINPKDVVLRLNVQKRNKLNYLQLYNSLSKITLILIFSVICAGGFVRMTGSGMGCPDWPKCFGLWIPPTDASALPQNYKEIYADRGYDVLDFNVYNTWIEYINRLLGLVSGIFCFVLLLVSIFTRVKWLIFSTFLLVILMAFQGWMGAKVVYSVLEPFKITIHMFIALLIISLLLFLYRATIERTISYSDLAKKWIVLAILISLGQIILGTQVREAVDILIKDYDKVSLIAYLPSVFSTHKIIALLVLISNIGIVFYYRKKWANFLPEISGIIFIVTSLILTGSLMSHYGLIGILQLLHLIFAASLLILQVSILLKQSSLPTVKFP